MNKLVVKLFNASLETDSKVEFSELLSKALKVGYVIHPNASTSGVEQFIDNECSYDYNTTFYKSWETIRDKTRFELFLDQILHYSSTYGTNYKGECWIPEDAEIELPEIRNYKFINVITKDEVIKRCEKMLFSGIALKEETMNDILDILKGLKHKVDIEKVKNKEAKMRLYKETGTLPNDSIEFIRYLTFTSTGSTLLIQNAEMFTLIQMSRLNISKLIEDFGMVKLSSMFLRYKNIFLAFKRANKKNSTVINKLRKLAVNNHKSITSRIEVLDLVKMGKLNSVSDVKQILSKFNLLKDLNNFGLVKLIETIEQRRNQTGFRFFPIRNQKLWVKEQTIEQKDSNANLVKAALRDELVTRLKTKFPNGLKVKLTEGVNLTLPRTEKSFVGNVPLGTSFDFEGTHNIFGINWKGSEGAQDLDLAIIDLHGYKIGWNASYKTSNNSIVYSGDMTSANPQATELMYCAKGFNDGLIKVNGYNYERGAKFRFFVAKEEIKNMKRNYMVNPDNIIFQSDCVMESREKMLGVVSENKLVITQFRTGNKRVSETDITTHYIQFVMNNLNSYVYLKDIIEECEFEITNENEDIDFTNLSKDTLIDFLS